MNINEFLKSCTGFDWDEFNSKKNWIKHSADKLECEQIFFNEPLIVADDVKHSKKEIRLYGLGKTDLGRRLFVVFTIRNLTLIRIISARDMSKKERSVYLNYE